MFNEDFLDYYFQALGYIASRKDRRARFDADTEARSLSPSSSEYAKEFKSYCGRERVILRRRRTKLRVEQFHIIAQVGQGGYGEVFLARKLVRVWILFSKELVWIIDNHPGNGRSLCPEENAQKNTLQDG